MSRSKEKWKKYIKLTDRKIENTKVVKNKVNFTEMQEKISFIGHHQKAIVSVINTNLN
jgi:hypothetical protein